MSESDSLEIARELIRYPSVTPEDAGVQKYLTGVLQQSGLSCRELPFGDISNFYARIGDNGPHLCFAGHTDVVPPGDENSWSHPPFAAEVADGRLYGRGAVDMKGGIAAFAAALSAYIRRHGQPPGSVSLLITGDEEGDAVNGTVRVLQWMEENGEIPDFCLVGEPTNPEKVGEQIKPGRRGSLSGDLTVEGVQGHVAYQHLADNPLPKLVRMLERLNAYVWDEGSEFFPPTNLEITNIDVGNSAGNVIPARGKASFNIRFNDKWNSEKLERRIREILNREKAAYQLEMTAGSESFLTPPGKYNKMLQDAVEKVTGRKPAFTTEGGTSDARFISRYCPVLEFGLVNSTAHKVDEHIEVDALKELEKTYLRFMEMFFEM